MEGSRGARAAKRGRKDVEMLREKYKWFEPKEMKHSEEEFETAVKQYYASIESKNLELLKQAISVIARDIWCVDHECVQSMFSNGFVFSLMTEAVECQDNGVLTWALLCICRMMVVSEDIQQSFCEMFKFMEIVKLTSHEDRNVSLQAIRIVRVLLEHVMQRGLNVKLARLLEFLQSCVFGSQEHNNEIAYILKTLATYAPIEQLFGEETYTQMEHPSLVMELLYSVSMDDYVDFEIIECMLRTTTILLGRDPRIYPVLRHWYLPQLYERVRESEHGKELSLKQAVMEMMDTAIDNLPPEWARDMISYLPIKLYFNGAFDWSYEAAKGCIHVLSYLVMLGDETCIALVKKENAVQKFSESCLHNGPFFMWPAFFEFCYVMNHIRDPEIASLITGIDSDFDKRFMDALDLDQPDVIGYALLSLWELLNTERDDRDLEIVANFRDLEGIHEKLSSIAEEMQGVTFTPIHEAGKAEVVPIAEVATRILEKLEEEPT